MNKSPKKPSPETPLNSENKPVSPFQRIKNITSENRKLFYWFGGLVIISILLFSGFKVYLEEKEKKRTAALYKLEILLAKESNSEAVSMMELFIVKNSKNKQGDLARYYLANYYIKKKDYKKVQEWLESIDLQIKDSQNTFSVLVSLSIANIYQIQGDYQSAVDTLVNAELVFLEDYVIFEIAQNLMLQGRTLEAKAHLQNLLRDFRGRRLESLVREILKVI